MNAQAKIEELRQEMAATQREARKQTRRQALRMAREEKAAWLEAQQACHDFDRILPRVRERLETIAAGARERFAGERKLAEMALHEAERADAAYAILSFAGAAQRERYLRGGAHCEAEIGRTLAAGGVCTGRSKFMEVLR